MAQRQLSLLPSICICHLDSPMPQLSPLPASAPLDHWLTWTQYLLNSFGRWTGKELIQRSSPQQELFDLWTAPKVVVSHAMQADPAFVYGNQLALKLWEMPLDEFLGMPSRLTAEPVHRDERQRLLTQTKAQGYVDDYSGIRISKTGNRFRIEKAILWMVVDESGAIVGQAATFDTWTPLAKS